MTEAEARAHQGVGGLEVWLSLQPWQPALDGWTIAGSGRLALPAHAGLWRASGQRHYPSWRNAVGVAGEGVILLQVRRDGATGCRT
jgi:hypothetical protein